MNNIKIKHEDDLTKSLEIVSDNISKLKELFPEVLIEGKIDFKVLQDILGNEIEVEEEEVYRFTWAGKSQARREAHKPSTGTLRPCKEESVDWDTTQNIYIEGDNLEVLKLLQKSYSNKIKMIYIDPPYNTGNDFVYKDDYKDNLKNYQQITGQVDDDGNKLTTNSESDGRYHSNWLNMIYPRLKLAKNLLKDDGLIFVSLDDNEVDNLVKTGKEVFGEENVELIIWDKEAEGKSGTLKQTSRYRKSHEYIIILYKNKSKTYFTQVSEPLIGKENELQSANLAVNEENVNPSHINNFEIISPNGKIWNKHWKFDKEKIESLIKQDLIYWGSDGNKQPRLILPTDHRRKVFSSSIIAKGSTTQGRKDFESIMPENVFSYPKPIKMLSHLIEIATNSDDIIFDFFSGSASTAHAIMQLNIDDSGNRKFVLAQLPEKTDEKSDAFKSGFKTISDIGKERIRRVGVKIKEANLLHSNKLDIGFKVFKLDSSNIKSWDGNPDNIEANLFESQDNIKTDRTEEDVLFEILLKYGLDLTLPIEQKEIEGKNVYNIGFGALFICLADTITSNVAEGIGKWKEEIKPVTCRVIFKDAGFDDKEKANSLLILKRCGIQEIKSI